MISPTDHCVCKFSSVTW